MRVKVSLINKKSMNCQVGEKVSIKIVQYEKLVEYNDKRIMVK